MTSLRPLPRDAPVDLHLHTIHSDGQWRPEALFDHLADRGFRIVAVTDHDTVDTYDELSALGAERGVLVIPGVEATANWHGRLAHVLCFASVPIEGPLRALVRETEQAMLDNTAAVHRELLRRGYRFPRQRDVLPATAGVPRRPIDNATLLHAHRDAPDMATALAIIADAGYRIASAPIGRVVDAAHASGAVALLAHPGRGGGEIQDYPPDLLGVLLDEVALDGVEAHYPLHTEAQTASYEHLAHQRGLLVSCGSDSHGPAQRFPIGYQASIAHDLLERLGISLH